MAMSKENTTFICGKEKCKSYIDMLKELKNVKKLTRKLDTVIDSSYDGIYITDGNAITIRVNKAYERITGLKIEEFLGKNVTYLVEKGIISKACSTIVLEKKEVVTIEQTLKSGKILLVTGTPIFDDSGEIEMVVTNVRDITELILLKEEVQKKKEKVDKYNNELRRLKSQLGSKIEDKVISRNKGMNDLLSSVKRVASHETTVLITGETGVGKEVITEYIHKNSSRSKKKLIKVNCGAIPSSLIESELFGYEKGAFTGANQGGKIGIFEEANGGTLLLDEIGELPYNMQAKLLRILQEQEIQRVGGVETIKIDVRIIAATNKNLKLLAEKGEFRMDLYYRLSIIPIQIPPLRDRKEDIIPLTNEFLYSLYERYGNKKCLSKNAYEVLYNYKWPGNIRELKNLIERVYVMVSEERIEADDIPLIKESLEEYDKSFLLKDAVAKLEYRMIEEAYDEFGNVREAARHLGIDASTFVRKRQKYERKLIKQSQS
ncbi:MAG: sigma 54-interacting transcriptional regulator [Acidaminobacteraceae bacterium]